MCTHDQCFEQKYYNFSSENYLFFIAVKNFSLLHGRVFVFTEMILRKKELFRYIAMI